MEILLYETKRKGPGNDAKGSESIFQGKNVVVTKNGRHCGEGLGQPRLVPISRCHRLTLTNIKKKLHKPKAAEQEE